MEDRKANIEQFRKAALTATRRQTQRRKAMVRHAMRLRQYDLAYYLALGAVPSTLSVYLQE